MIVCVVYSCCLVYVGCCEECSYEIFTRDGVTLGCAQFTIECVEIH